MNAVLNFKNQMDNSPIDSLPIKVGYATYKTVKKFREDCGTSKTFTIDASITALLIAILPSCRTHMCNLDNSGFFSFACWQVLAYPLAGLLLYDSYQYVQEKLQHGIPNENQANGNNQLAEKLDD
ncbi:MAG: hypothetical protein Q8K75_01855 [Chlamydiales bacterium]|nr:hypothetical protein [Chlamydiales bacterium]